MLMEDEAGFYRQPSMASVWAAQGRIQPRATWTTRTNSVIRAAAAFDPVHGGLLHRLRSSFTAVEMGRFYQYLAKARPDLRRIYLVMDNWPIHSHPRAWKYLDADARLKVLWLPTYAPWLNPTEKIWKWLRQKLVHMHAFSADMQQLRQRIDELLSGINQIPQEILRYTATGNDKLYSS